MMIVKYMRMMLVLLMFVPLIAIPTTAATSEMSPIPTMAYYYIWFDVQSWDRAKTDYPLLGRYSSDDREVMQEHVRLAKEAGVDGFIVSWKSTLTLDRRLKQLIDVAEVEDFDLWIIYQGLDFERQPLPVDRIVNDLEYFVENFARSPVFARYDAPVVILSGTWEFSAEEISTITTNFKYGDRLYLLSSERDVEGYLRLASYVDGNAYYWSSVDPTTTPGYAEKLREMSDAVHKNQGIWIAPAAPGFDARLIGGTRVVDRRHGQTLREELRAALHSNPDAIGIISWNEFSENTHIEPSEQHGREALDVLMRRQANLTPNVTNFDSSEPGKGAARMTYQPAILVGIFLLTAFSLSVVLWRKTTA